MPTILCVIEASSLPSELERCLIERGDQVVIVPDWRAAHAAHSSHVADLVLTDMRGGASSAGEIRSVTGADDAALPVVLLAGRDATTDALAALQEAGSDVLAVPPRPDLLVAAVTQLLSSRTVRRELAQARRELAQARGRRRIVGRSRAILDLQESIATLAPTAAPIVLEGEAGTGKELVALAIHDLSRRGDRPLVTIHCASMPVPQLEAALFGQRKGAVLGAMERAAGGTLVLDDIPELPLDLQARLVRSLEEGSFVPVEGRESLPLDVRLIVTTDRPLDKEVAAGQFRADLYYLLQAGLVRIPPLRERPDDIPLLVHGFLLRAETTLGVKVGELDLELMPALQRYPWPGNVRELFTALERAVVLARGRPLTLELLARDHPGLRGEQARKEEVSSEATIQDLRFDLERLERETIQRALDATEGNRAQAARLLGISDRTLRNKLKPPTLP